MLHWLRYLSQAFFSFARREKKPLPRATNVTVLYPHEKLPVPEVGRYQLHVVIEDCIGCDLCARICPVDCITIEKVRKNEATTTRSGHPRRFDLPRFDIDLSLCCFCGLCTVVCPTECITMQPTYAYSTPRIQELIKHFGEKTSPSSNSAEIRIFPEV
ncbi:MAG: 4Fe-4S binding protein [Bacteroidia bacterium]